MKMPEPIQRDDTEHGKDYYTAEQMKQYGRDLLEEAINECKRLEIAIDGGGNAYYRPADARQCVEAIRKLKETL